VNCPHCELGLSLLQESDINVDDLSEALLLIKVAVSHSNISAFLMLQRHDGLRPSTLCSESELFVHLLKLTAS